MMRNNHLYINISVIFSTFYVNGPRFKFRNYEIWHMPTKVQVRTKLTSCEIYKYDNLKRHVVFWIENKRVVVYYNICNRKIRWQTEAVNYVLHGRKQDKLDAM